MNAARCLQTVAGPGAALLLVFSAPPATADSPQVWSWHQAGQEIHSPAISPDGREVAFSLQRRRLTGRDVQDLSSAQLTEHLDDQREDLDDNDRVFDPMVVIVTLATGKIERIGYGYDPAFAPDGKSLAFQYQKNALAGRRADGPALVGNEIWLHDRVTGRARVLAAPASRWFARPGFAPDGTSVIFAIQDTAMSWTGTVGVASVELASGAVSMLYAPRTTHKLPHVVGDVGFVGGTPYAVVLIPQEPGRASSVSYLCQLVALDGSEAVRYDWGAHEVAALNAAFGTWRDGRIAVFDFVWKPIGSGEPVTAAASTARGWRSTRGVLSPDGRKIAREFVGGVVVTDTLTGRTLAEYPGWMPSEEDRRRSARRNVGNMLEGITWSPDSRRIAWVDQVGLSSDEFATLRIASL